VSARRVSVTLLIAAGVVLGGALPAAAHGDDGVFAGTEATPGSGLSVNVRARLVYANDNEPAPGAFVVVDAVDAAGMSTAPELLTDNRDGTYQGVLALPAPGAWTVRFQSMTPNATAEVAFTAPAPVGPTSAPTTTATGSTRNGSGNGDEDGGGSTVLVIVAGVTLAVGAVLVWYSRRR
jgi:hypothetical protein